MATRALINFAKREEGVSFNEHPGIDAIHTQIYHHYDGYPEYLGIKLAEFLNGFKIVNGLGQEEDKIANGMGCLTAQVLANLKEVPGNVYLEKPRNKDWEDYQYFIWATENKDVWISVFDYYDKCIFVGTPAKLIDKYKPNTNEEG